MNDLDDETSRALVHLLERGTLPASEGTVPIRVWRELLNGRWICLLTYRDQTYCLLPLHYPAPAWNGDAAKDNHG